MQRRDCKGLFPIFKLIYLIYHKLEVFSVHPKKYFLQGSGYGDILQQKTIAFVSIFQRHVSYPPLTFISIANMLTCSTSNDVDYPF